MTDRRSFIKGAVASTTLPLAVGATATETRPATKPPVAGPSPWLRHAETATEPPAEKTEASVRGTEYIPNPGSDYMVDVLRSLGIAYVSLTPGATFRGLQESISNYAPGTPGAPVMIECLHEEISAAICHGYAKAAGKPMACIVHSNVGLQHASMAIYNAWCDRVPMIVMVGGDLQEYGRKGFVEWIHSAQDSIAMVRDFTKFDDAPKSLERWTDSMTRAYAIGCTPPQLPTAVVVDRGLQEDTVEHPERLHLPRRPVPQASVGAPASIAQAAELLLAADRPVLIADRSARTRAGLERLVALAELLNAPVVNQFGRMNFPSRHYLNHTADRALIGQADVVLTLEVSDLFSTLYANPDVVAELPPRRKTRRGAKVIDISSNYLYGKFNMQDQQRHVEEVELRIAADAEDTLPLLIDAIKARMTPALAAKIKAREAPARARSKGFLDAEREAAARGWDTSPISTARLSMEIMNAVGTNKWSLVSSTFNVSYWPQRLWDMTDWEHDLGGPGGFGVGYQLPAAVGAGIALKGSGRIPINIQPDGDMMMLPGALWTAAHHEVPLLTIMHNNRAWHQETMHLLRMSNRRDRTSATWRQGTLIESPHIDYALLAKSMGVWAEGPITEPGDLAAALKRAVAVVKSGRPALLDVITQPR